MRVAIAGCAGRMGQVLIKKVLMTPGLELSGGSERVSHTLAGKEVGSLVQVPTPGVLVTTDPEELFIHSDAVIDFTTPEYSLLLGELAAKHKKVLVCGTTALLQEGLAVMKKHAKKAVIICSPNFSVGINIVLGIVERISAIMGPEECDVEIDEMHHRFKVDSPSGTALTLGAAVARGRDMQLSDLKADYQQSALAARKQGAIGFSVRRGGDVIGDHTVTFACAGERIELAHKASSREIYATGAVRAVQWAKNKPAGFYTMRDVLGI